MKFLLYLSLVFILTGCSVKTPSIETKEEIPQTHQAKITDTLESTINKNIGNDCSDFVSIVNQELNNIYFDEKELDFSKGVGKSQAIYNLYEKQGKISTKDLPSIGDLIFFKDTVKPSKKSNSQITHIGIVQTINNDNTIIFLHNINGKVTQGYINLDNMDSHNINGKIVNSFIVRCTTKSTPNHKCLSSKFLAGYGKVNGKEGFRE